MANETMEVIWKSSVDGNIDLFTGVLYNYYFPPPNYCWDLLCNDEPIMDNPLLHDYNVDRQVDQSSRTELARTEDFLLQSRLRVC